MRTTVVLPSPFIDEIRSHIGQASLSKFVREAVEARLAAIRHASLICEMEAGYAAEAAAPSLDREWAATEADRFA